MGNAGGGNGQAEEDLNIHVNYVYLAKDDTALEQAAVIRRELRNGSSGILLAAADSQGIQKAFETTVFPVPVICVETGAGKEIPVIRSDDRAMGRALGEAILADMDKTGNERRVTVIKEYAQRDSIEMRYQGLARGFGRSWRRGCDRRTYAPEYRIQSGTFSDSGFL